MESQHAFDDLAHHLSRQFALDTTQALRLIEEVNEYFNESYQQYIERRHQELRRRGMNNRRIFQLISEELQQRRFTAPQLSERQLRRTIYG